MPYDLSYIRQNILNKCINKYEYIYLTLESFLFLVRLCNVTHEVTTVTARSCTNRAWQPLVPVFDPQVIIQKILPTI